MATALPTSAAAALATLRAAREALRAFTAVSCGPANALTVDMTDEDWSEAQVIMADIASSSLSTMATAGLSVDLETIDILMDFANSERASERR